MNVFASIDTLEFVKSGELIIEDYDADWIRLNIEKADPDLIDQYLAELLQFIRKTVNARIRILKCATNVIFNLPYCF